MHSNVAMKSRACDMILIFKIYYLLVYGMTTAVIVTVLVQCLGLCFDALMV